MKLRRKRENWNVTGSEEISESQLRQKMDEIQSFGTEGLKFRLYVANKKTQKWSHSGENRNKN